MELKNRIESLDLFRGFAVFLMVFSNALAGYSVIPDFLKHAPANGFTMPDIVMPLFLFAIGYSMRLSLKSRVKKTGPVKTAAHFVFRNLLLVLFGFLGTLLVREYGWWGVLETLGFTGLLAIPILFLQPLARCLVVTGLLAVYQAAVGFFGINVIGIFLVTGLGGPFGSLSWLFILTAGSCLYDWMNGRNYPTRIVIMTLSGIVLIVAGVIVNLVVPFSKHLVSASYVLLSAGICAYLFMLFSALAEQFKFGIAPVQIMGKNALFLYMFSSLLVVGENYILSSGTNIWLVFAGCFTVLALTWLAAWLLDIRKTYIKL